MPSGLSSLAVAVCPSPEPCFRFAGVSAMANVGHNVTLDEYNEYRQAALNFHLLPVKAPGHSVTIHDKSAVMGF